MYPGPFAIVPTLVALLFLPTLQAQGDTASLAVSGYQLINSQPVTRTVYEFEYRANLTNAGTTQATHVAGTVRSLSPDLQVTTSNLSWGTVPSAQTVMSVNTFKIRMDRTKSFQPSDLAWTITDATTLAPSAAAGMSQRVGLGDLVRLNGGGSTDPQGLPLTYAWSFTEQPSGCAAVLSQPTSVLPTFTASCVGMFTVELVVTNTLGIASAPSQLSVSTSAVQPSADAGRDLSVTLTRTGQSVLLNGSDSRSPGGLPLTYRWSILSGPEGSATQLTNPTSVTPSLVPDKLGSYVIQLIVNNGYFDSQPDTVVVTTGNVAPTANAGIDGFVSAGLLVQLNGSASTDANSLPLVFSWAILTKPDGSKATLSDATLVNPTFTADKQGTYVVQLTVANPYQGSDADTVVFSAGVPAPVANAGPDQIVAVGATVTLTGAFSDRNGGSLTYRWALIRSPAGSAAVLAGSEAISPTFVADMPGDYIAQLIVNNGSLSSPPDTVLISTGTVPPVAAAGPDQNVRTQDTVSLDGTASRSPGGHPLTYSWSFTSRPANSNAVLQNPTSAHPSFIADVDGLYVVQLIVNDAIQGSSPDTVQVAADSQKRVSLRLQNPELLTLDTGTVTVSLSTPAPAGGVGVSLRSSSQLIQIPSFITVPAGATAANISLTTSTTTGQATISASASGYLDASLSVAVSIRKMSFGPSNPTLSLGGTMQLTLSLQNPAPGPYGVHVDVYPDPNILIVQEGSFQFQAGQTQTTFSFSTVATGEVTLRASAPGFESTSIKVTCTEPYLVTPPSVAVGVGRSEPYTVTLSEPAALGGLIVSVTSGDPSVATISPATLIFLEGTKVPMIQPYVSGKKQGTVQITASAPRFTASSGDVHVQGSLRFSDASVAIAAGQSKLVTLTSDLPAPAGGLTVVLNSSAPSKSTVPASVLIPAGGTQVECTISAASPGAAVITAAAEGFGSASVSVSVTNLHDLSLSSAGRRIGKDLQIMNVVTVVQPPRTDLMVTLQSEHPNLRISLLPTDAGSPSAAVTIRAGALSSTPFYVQNTGVNTGAGTLKLSGAGYNTSQAQLAFAPSGFILPLDLAPTQELYYPGMPPFPIVARVVSLTDAGQPESTDQTLRGGLSPVSVSFSISTSSSIPVVSVVPAVPLSSGQNVVPVTVTLLSRAAVTISVGAPAGFTTPTSQVAYQLSILHPPITATVKAVGSNLQTELIPDVLPSGAPYPGVNVSFFREDGRIAISYSSNTVGTASAGYYLSQGGSSLPWMYVQNLGADSGSTAIYITAPGYASSRIPINLVPAGLTPADSYPVHFISQGAPVASSLVAVNSDGIVQKFRAGLSVPVTFASSDASVAQVLNPITCAQSGCSYTIVPVGLGSAAISVVQPPGFSAVAAVTPQMVSVSPNGFTSPVVNVGYNLVGSASLSLTRPNADTTQVTVKSRHKNLLLSFDPAAIGTASVTFTLPEGSTSLPLLYLQNTGSQGEVGYVSIAASGYGSEIPINLVGAGFGLPTTDINLSVLGPPVTSSVYSYAVVNGAAVLQPVRPGYVAKVYLGMSVPGVISVPSPVAIQAAGTATFAITPLFQGATLLFVQGDPTLTLVKGITEQSVGVNRLLLTTSSILKVGRNLQEEVVIKSDAPMPAGGGRFTVTSDNASLLLSASPDTVGSNSIELSVPAGATTFKYYAQNVGASSGTAKVSFTYPGLPPQPFTETLCPSGFTYFVHSLSAPLSMGTYPASMNSVVLDPISLAPLAAQAVRPGISEAVVLTNSNPAVVSVPSFVVLSGTSSVAVPVVLRGPGTAVLGQSVSPGYATPANFGSMTFQVTQ